MKIHIVSLGCARALVDSEGLGGLLVGAGHTLTERVEEAECAVVNTCGFIREAEEESISVVLDLARAKKAGRLERLYVVGCLPQKRRRERADFMKLLPEVDGFLGTGDLPRLPGMLGKRDRFFVASPVSTLLFDASAPRHRLTPGYTAYLKISEGCDHACSFCSIPQYRGPHRSRPVEDVVRQAQRLAAQGVAEVNLIGQDSSAYGKDLTGRLMLPELLRRLDAVAGLRWIRILYAHPAHVTDEMIAAMRDCAKVVPYLDIPLQHISDDLLAAMRRQTDGAWIRDLIRRLREAIPAMALRSTFIVGFPGETERHVEELSRFLEEARLERVGMFRYTPEPRTSAERMKGVVPEPIQRRRLDRLMRLQREIAREIHRTWVGRTLEVLIEQTPEPGVYLGRSYADAPEVDGQVTVTSSRRLEIGAFAPVRVTDSTEYDLVGEAA